MVKKNDQEIVDKRLEETLDLFQPTARQEAAAEQPEEKPPVKSRRYEADNPAFAFRILPEDSERITSWAERLELTRDDVARGLVGAALEALDEGRLELKATHQVSMIRDAAGRRRRSVRAFMAWVWKKKVNP